MLREIFLSAFVLTVPVAGRQSLQPPDTYSDIKSDAFIPLVSIVAPGLGQYFHGDAFEGLTYSLAGFTGLVLYSSDTLPYTSPVTLNPDAQRKLYGWQLYQDAGLLSAYRAFARSVPAFQHEDNRYTFLPEYQPLSHILLAPFTPRYLTRVTTILPLAALGGLIAWDRANPGGGAGALGFRNAIYVLGTSYNAGIAEEAFFRGYIYPYAHQRLGESWLASNSTQALLFGIGHLDPEDLSNIPVIQTLMGWYWGWITYRNDWSIAEAAFIHFWWDVVAIGYELITAGPQYPVSLSVSIPF